MNCKKMQAVFVLVMSAFIMPTSLHAQDITKRPALHEFVTQILEEHPSLLSAEANLRAVNARARGKSKPIYNPEIEIGFETNRDRTREIGISQTFDWSGKRRANAKVGNAEIAAGKAIFRLARKDLLTELLQKLTSYQTAMNTHKVAQDRNRLSEEFLEIADRRNKAGELPRSELLTAKLALSEAQVAMNEAWSNLSQTEEDLIALVGEEYASWPILVGAPAYNNLQSSDYDVDLLPEMIFASSQSDIFREQINVAKSKRNPDPTVGLRLAQEGGGSRFDAEPKHKSIGISLSIPIPVRNNYQTEVTAAGADFNQAEQNYQIARRQMMARLDASMARYQSAAQAWQEWNELGAMPLNEQRTLLKKLLDAQEISAVDYLIQLNQTFDVERTSIELNGRLWNAWFAWKSASGSLEKWLETIQ